MCVCVRVNRVRVLRERFSWEAWGVGSMTGLGPWAHALEVALEKTVPALPAILVDAVCSRRRGADGRGAISTSQ